ncbi:hypothetical protein BATDEDRAFT_34941 [Batrachochytrium dendrobatidis JAM81]|uniref:Dipeptidyl-peptidase IV n=1 Tax=Batrachochytrium dendrobatidis (strain JAM81 / FGSC 10211) TaxID=684364 RepID=F4P1G2_BATDJ|nr:uncharacterized protein BATDEDRAFT_34941 [Batrachochytrium dendrobatidis JAM81]EGF80903.1 hypothetical protein BATDEDRAFT_34941 [Batrachochytrium dendrobatidis JAM81]KAJ8328725.1 Dipeptidyl peptidase 4 [Batrachochytrium dendrobatidis]KAK5668681.1 Dipeptidyl peptidase 4 [Batrachochytrium dendrobatidis]|eukprot:XP_006678570.1 hypothetical protein BATDEDRAFT_34941 [Batrachochytrium dendrobatidis JAM81]
MTDIRMPLNRQALSDELNEFDKLTYAEEDRMLEEGDARHADHSSLTGVSGHNVRNRRDKNHSNYKQRPSWRFRAPLILFGLLILVLVSIVFLALRTNSDRPFAGRDGEAKTINGRPAVTDRLLGLLPISKAEDIDPKWVQDSQAGFPDGSFLELDQHKFVVRQFGSTNSTVIADIKNINDKQGNAIEFSTWTASADLKYLLLTTNYQKGWRHSFFADYYLYDIKAKQAKPLANSVSDKHISNELGSGMVALTAWSPKGHSVAWVRDNDLYVTVEGTTEVRITTDGSYNIINGLSDWVYEEEVLGKGKALWFSPDGSHIAYLKFNDTLVKTFPLEYFSKFGENAYPRELNLKYPKAGSPNPVVTLHIVTPLSTNVTEQSSPVHFGIEGFADQDRLIVEVNWLTSNDTLMVRLMNRVQDIQRLFLVKGTQINGIFTWKADLVRDEATPDGAWHNILQPLTPILSSNFADHNDPSYVEIMDSANGYAHLAYFDDIGRASPTMWITSGTWEVTGIVRFDEAKDIIYFMSTEHGSTERHLYSVHLDGSGKKRHTPQKDVELKKVASVLNETYGLPLGDSGYFDVKLSPKCGYSIVLYTGPDVPYRITYKIEDSGWRRVDSVENTKLRESISKVALPQISYFTIPNQIGNDMNVKMIVPPDFDPSGKTKYPVLMQVYGGPYSQMVNQKWNLDFMYHLPLIGFVSVIVDGRGTGFKGRKFRNAVSKQLGLHEVEDQIEAGRWLGQQKYIDSKKIGIWGWSYGGYMAAKCIEANSGVFALGMSVAPVTDWRFYDTVYTERYMKTPVQNPEGYAKSAVSNMTGFSQSRYLLIHGTGDDNVHFQNSAMLVWHFTGANLSPKNVRVQYYTDSDHSISDNGANPQVFGLLTSYACDTFRLNCNQGFDRLDRRDLSIFEHK